MMERETEVVGRQALLEVAAAAGGTLRVKARQCATCIFRQGTGMHPRLDALLDEIRDPYAPDQFIDYRLCHDGDDACCRGFWRRYKDRFTLGQLAQRWGLVEEVGECDDGA